jgi:ATP-binding cassette, subfamily B, bacterial
MRLRRLAGVLVGSGFRAAPLLTTASLVMAVVGSLASVSYTVGFRIMVDAAAKHEARGVVVGVVLVASLFTLSWVISMIGGMQFSVLTDRVNVYMSGRIARLVAAAPSLDLLERPERLRELDQLRDGRRALAGTSRQLLKGLQTGVRGLGIIVLLATVYPPILIVPLLGIVPALADRQANRLQKRADDDLAEDRRMVADLFALATTADRAKELRIYGVTDAVVARHAALSERIRARSVRAALRSAGWEAAGWLVYAAGFVIAIVVLVVRAAHGHTSPGQVVMAVSLLRRAQTQVSGASDTAGAMGANLTTARRLIALEDQVAAESTVSGAPVPDRLTDGIRLEGVSFGYPGSDEPVLSGVDLSLPAGSTVAVVGDNGAGKTTLVKLLTGMYRPTSGRIMIDDVDLAEIGPVAWRSRTAGAFQDFVRFQLLAGETVGVGDLPRSGDSDAVRSAVDRSGASSVIAALPDGLQTPPGRTFTGGRELSGGQWQRLALARGLMRDDPLLTVLDEPTASLDAAAESAVFERYAAAAAGRTASGAVTLLVSHRFSTVRIADLIVVISDGRIAEVGSHQALMAAGGVYADLFGLQARGYS